MKKGNSDLLDWLNNELTELPSDFIHKDYEETLLPVYGDQVSPDELVIENGHVEG